MTHDPSRFLNDLRSVLASPNARILFLFGAGSSSAVRVPDPEHAGADKPCALPLIPAVEALTQECKTRVVSLGESFASAWTQIVEGCEAAGQPPHLESILSRLRATISAAGPGSSQLGLNATELGELENEIQKTVARLTNPSEDQIPAELPQHMFARWVRGARRTQSIEIFTTNYDILLERSLERAGVFVFDGFVGSHEPFFSPSLVSNPRLGSDSAWVGLWKLHGSVNWESRPSGTGRPARTVRTGPSSAGTFIYPSDRKYDESRKMPYTALMDRFAKRLAIDGTVLVTIGYGWGDDHLNAAILDALDEHPSVTVIALMYSDVEKNARLVSYAKERRNLLAIGGRTAVVNERCGPWQHALPLDATGGTLIDSWFDSDAAKPDEDDGSKGGRMRLGDFNYFAEFLQELGQRAWSAPR
jgi:hypothetical protein